MNEYGNLVGLRVVVNRVVVVVLLLTVNLKKWSPQLKYQSKHEFKTLVLWADCWVWKTVWTLHFLWEFRWFCWQSSESFHTSLKHVFIISFHATWWSRSPTNIFSYILDENKQRSSIHRSIGEKIFHVINWHWNFLQHYLNILSVKYWSNTLSSDPLAQTISNPQKITEIRKLFVISGSWTFKPQIFLVRILRT